MSEIIEILDRNDVEDIAREFLNDSSDEIGEMISEWMSMNIQEYVPSEYEIEGIVESQIEGEMRYGSTGDRIDNLEAESSDYEARIHALERQDSADWKLLEERVADLERRNAALLTTLGQFAQLLTHRDLI